jgi:hypothetical protein
METNLLPCSFEGCTQKVEPRDARVPALQAIRRATGKVPEAEADLAGHVFCKKHAAMARGAVQMFSYLGTVAELKRRAKERETVLAFFSLRYAFQKAGVGNGKPN